MAGILGSLGWQPGGDPARLTAAMALLIITLVVVKGTSFFGGSYLVVLASQRIEHRIRLDVYSHLLRISFVRMSELPRGDVVSRFVQDVSAFKFAITHGVTNLVRDALQIVVLTTLAISLDPVLGVIALAVLPVTSFVILRLGARLRSRRRKAFDAYGDLAGTVDQTTAALPVIRTFKAEAHAQLRFTALSEAILSRNLRAWGIQIFSSPIMELLGAVALAGTLWYAGYRIGSGSLAPEEFVSFFAAVFLLYHPVKTMGEASNHVQNGLGALDRLRQLLEIPTEEPDGPDAIDVKQIEQGIRFEGVGFSYGSEAVLDDVSFEVKAGETLALAGASGAGKTTVAMMLLRLIEPEAGRITIDGKDLRQISRASLRDAFALVTQEPVLLHDTIQANISFGLPAELGQVEAAARAAGAHGFISGLPEGYLTSVGEAGSRLSGGERQRICIARALLRNPPALILDEATAAVDSATEVEIAASLQELMRGRTSLLISHRLSTVRRADRIVVLDRGKVVALGAFDELVREPGPFQRIFHDQLSVNGVGTGDEGE
jgi:subfamily B ATP-binding cassette protein MsbA